MANEPRFWVNNHIFAGAGLDSSSDSLSNPVEALEDQQRTYFWRTATGWTFTAHNNKIDFDIGGGTLTATIANGTYATAAAVITVVVAALEAAAAGPAWAVTYIANKFNIATGGVVYTLMWKTGPNEVFSAGRSLGFIVTADDSGANNYTADHVTYQSTHHLVITIPADQLTALGQPTAAAVIGHNCSGNSMLLQSNTTNDWSAPTLRANFSGFAATDVRQYFVANSHAFFRLSVDDVSNTDGYYQLGKLVLSTWSASPWCFSVERTDQEEDMGEINVSIPGTNFPNFRSKRETLNLAVEDVEDSATNPFYDLLRFNVFDPLSVGENFILDLDPGASANFDFFYGYLPAMPSRKFVPFQYWRIAFTFLEAL
jgi:hypothetical protein